MELDPTITAAIVGFTSAVITASVAVWFGYKKLKTEMLSQHRQEFIKKQIEACEKLWGILEPFSFTDGDERVILDPYENPRVAVETARELTKQMMKVFYSPAGLYFSRNLRREFFALRDFMKSELISVAERNNNEVNISKNKMKRFRNHITRLRNAIRTEIGTGDLQVAKEGPFEG